MHNMLKPLLISLACSLHLSVNAQSGCTDPSANNYNAHAVTNNGSCAYAPVHYAPILKGELPKDLTESSGLLWDEDVLWSHNDSGNPPELYKLDTANGHIIQKVKITDEDNIDWEDITADKKYIYIGDFGNNRGNRDNLSILRIEKKDIDDSHKAHVKARKIKFSYADQEYLSDKPYQHNYDCEALICIDDYLYIFTKDWADMKTRVYKIPKEPGKYKVQPYDSFDVKGFVTSAAYNPQTRQIVLLGYTGWMKYSFMWFLSDYNGDHFFTGNKRRIDMGDGSAWQTEGITFISPTRFFISNEKEGNRPASLYAGSIDWQEK